MKFVYDPADASSISQGPYNISIPFETENHSVYKTIRPKGVEWCNQKIIIHDTKRA